MTRTARCRCLSPTRTGALPISPATSRFGEERKRRRGCPRRLSTDRLVRRVLVLRAPADGRAFQRRAGLSPALALAGILSLAGIVGALAGALALAGVDAGAVVGGLRVRLRSRQRAGREHRSRGDDKRFPHTTTPSKVTRAAPKATPHAHWSIAAMG